MKTLRPLVGSLRQLASVRQMTLNDGPDHGVRALLFSCGGGLDALVLADRSLDVGTLSYRGVPLAWQSPAGFRHPALHDAEEVGGTGFNRSFSGFLITAGLDHIRGAREGKPQHGRFPFTPARLTACGEDWQRDPPVLFCEGEVIQWRYGGEGLRLVRRIEMEVGGTALRIFDRVENIAAHPTPFACLYHVNLGYPAIGPGTRLELEGRCILGPIAFPDPAPPEAAVTHELQSSPTSRCTVATPHAGGTLTVRFAYDTASLPHLQIWKDLRAGTGVLSIEPCTEPRPPDGTPRRATLLESGAVWQGGLTVTVSGEAPEVVPRGG